MPRVRFIADFDYKPTRSVTIAYQAGMELLVRRDCALQAFAAGKAVATRASKERKNAEAEIER